MFLKLLVIDSGGSHVLYCWIKVQKFLSFHVAQSILTFPLSNLAMRLYP